MKWDFVYTSISKHKRVPSTGTEAYIKYYAINFNVIHNYCHPMLAENNRVDRIEYWNMELR